MERFILLAQRAVIVVGTPSLLTKRQAIHRSFCQTRPNSTAYKNFTCLPSFLPPWCLVDLHGTASFADGVILVDRARRCSRDAHQIDHPPSLPSSSSFAFSFAGLSPPLDSSVVLIRFRGWEERRMGCRRSVRHYILVPSVPTRPLSRTSCHYVTLTVWSNHDAHTHIVPDCNVK